MQPFLFFLFRGHLSSITTILFVPTTNFFFNYVSGEDCLSNVQLTGPALIDILQHPWVDLTCSFYISSSLEYSQLDLKWYFSTEEEPILQWVRSSGRKPQTIGQMFKNRLEVRHSSRTTSEGFGMNQNIRVQRLSVHLSGDYTCKVATFMREESSRHNIIIFGKFVDV
jgi:hypothetical protein